MLAAFVEENELATIVGTKTAARGHVRNLRKECVGLVAGQSVLDAEVTDGGIRKLLCRPSPIVRLPGTVFVRLSTDVET